MEMSMGKKKIISKLYYGWFIRVKEDVKRHACLLLSGDTIAFFAHPRQRRRRG
jgi:hypothetical protein